jgi:hypothetical protein
LRRDLGRTGVGVRERIVIGPGARGPRIGSGAPIVIGPGPRGANAGGGVITDVGVERPGVLGRIQPPARESLAAPWRGPVLALALSLPILPRRNRSSLAVIRRRVKRL